MERIEGFESDMYYVTIYQYFRDFFLFCFIFICSMYAFPSTLTLACDGSWYCSTSELRGLQLCNKT